MTGEVRTGSLNELKVGKFVIIDGHPCKVVNIQTSRPGKHGHAKHRIDAMSIFDGSKHGIMGPSHEKIQVPIIDKRSAQVLGVSGKTAQLMDLESFETFDADIPEGMKLEEGGQTPIWIVLDKKLLELA